MLPVGGSPDRFRAITITQNLTRGLHHLFVEVAALSNSADTMTASAMAALRVRRDKAALSSGCKPHPARSLQPEATGAVMEVTKWLKPSV